MSASATLRDERARGWFHLDNAVIDEYLPRIGVTAFAVYACIVRHADPNGEAFPSYTLLQKELRTGRHQVANAIRNLVDIGLITVTSGKRSVNVYHVVTVSTSAAEELVPQRNQFPTSTGTSSAPAPELVPLRHSNKTQLTRPIEQDPIVSLRSTARAKPPKPLLADFHPSEKEITDAIGYGVPSEQIAFQTEQWRDYHAAKGTPIKDLAASWRTWMRNHVTFAARDAARASPRAPTNGSRPVTFGAAIARGNAEADAEFGAMLEGSHRHEPRAFSGTDEPARRRLPGGDTR